MMVMMLLPSLLVLCLHLFVGGINGDILVNCTTSPCIKVGFSYASGRLDPEGGQMKNGYILWAEQVNAQGGIKTSSGAYKIQLIGYNDFSNATLSGSYYTQLINVDQVDYLLGPYGTSFSLVASAITNPARKVLILSSASGDACYQQGYDLIFGVVSTASTYAAPLITKLKALGASTVAIAYSSDSFSTSVKVGAVDSLNNAGLTILGDIGYDTNNATSAALQEVLNSIIPLAADVFMFFGLYDDSVLLTTLINSAGYKPKGLFMTSAPSQPDFVENGKAEYIFAPVQWDPHLNHTGPFFGTSAQYTQLYQARFNDNVTAISAQASAAALVLQTAIVVGNGIVNQSVLAEILRTTTFDSFFGETKFGPNGATTKPILITQVINGNIEVVLPEEYQTHPLIYPRSDYPTTSAATSTAGTVTSTGTGTGSGTTNTPSSSGSSVRTTRTVEWGLFIFSVLAFAVQL